MGNGDFSSILSAYGSTEWSTRLFSHRLDFSLNILQGVELYPPPRAVGKVRCHPKLAGKLFGILQILFQIVGGFNGDASLADKPLQLVGSQAFQLFDHELG